jgi:hypothetical protein
MVRLAELVRGTNVASRWSSNGADGNANAGLKAGVSSPTSSVNVNTSTVGTITIANRSFAWSSEVGEDNGGGLAAGNGTDSKKVEAGHGARFPTEINTRGCHWIPRMFA